jgi:hypothetical protein
VQLQPHLPPHSKHKLCFLSVPERRGVAHVILSRDVLNFETESYEQDDNFGHSPQFLHFSTTSRSQRTQSAAYDKAHIICKLLLLPSNYAKMHSTLVRAQNVFGFFTTVAFVVAALIAASDLTAPRTPKSSIQVKDVSVYVLEFHTSSSNDLLP